MQDLNPVLDVIRTIAGSLRSHRRKTKLAVEQDVYAEIGRIVSSPFSIAETYGRFAFQVKRVLGYDSIIITVLNACDGTFSIDYALGTAITGMKQGDVFPLENSFVSQVANSQKAIRCDPSNQCPNPKLFRKAGLISSIATPLIANEKVIGVLHLASAMDAAYDAQSLGMLERIGNQIAGATASGILLESERSRASQLNGVYQVAAIIVKPNSFEEKAQGIVELLAQLSMADLAVLWRGNEGGEGMEVVTYAGNIAINAEMSASLLAENSASGNALRQRKTIVINEYQTFSDASPVGRSISVESAFSTPIRSGDRILGLLSVASKTKNHFNSERVSLLTALADEIAHLFEAADLSQFLQASKAEMALVDEVAKIVTTTLNIQVVYERFAKEIRKLVVFDRIAIAIIDHDMQTTTVKYTYGDALPGRNVGDVIPLDESTSFPILSPRLPLFRGGLMRSTEPRSPADEEDLALGFCSSAIIPLMSRGQLIGTMGLRSRRVEAFGTREQAIILRLADQIAPAIENAILYDQSLKSEETQRHLADENASMAKIGRIIASPFSTDGVYDEFADIVQSLIPFDRIGLTSCDNEGKFVDLHVWGTAVTEWAKGDIFPEERPGFASAVVKINGPLITPTGADELGDEYPSLSKFRQAGLRSLLGCTLVSNDQLVGTIFLSSATEGAYTDREAGLLQRISNQIAGSIASATLLRSERDRNDELDALFNVSEIMIQPAEIEVKAQKTTEILANLLEADQVLIRRADENGKILSLVASGGSNPLTGMLSVRVLDQKSAIREAFTQGRPVLINDYQHYPDHVPSILESGLRSVYVMPIRTADRTTGILTVASRSTNHFNNRRVAVLATFGHTIGSLFASADLSESLEASRDELALTDDIARIVTSTTEVEEVYEKFATELKKLVDHDLAAVNIFNEDQTAFTMRYLSGDFGPAFQIGQSLQIENTLVALMLEAEETIVFGNIEEHPEIVSTEAHLREGLLSFVLAPLISGDSIFGFFLLTARRVNHFGDRERGIVSRLANQIAPALKNVELYEREMRFQQDQSRLADELSARSEEIALVDRIASIITSSEQIDDVYAYFSAELKRLIEFDRIVLNHIDLGSGKYKTRFVSGVHVNERGKGSEHQLGGSAPERLIQSGTFVIHDDLRTVKPTNGVSLHIDAGLRSIIGFPLFSNSEVIATLHLHSKQIAAFGSRELEILKRVALQITPAIANALSKEALDQGEARSRALLETTSDAILTIDDGGVVQSFNPSAEEMFGYSECEIIGQYFSTLMPKSEKSGYDEPISRYLAIGGAQNIGGAGRVLEAQKKDGSTFSMELWVGAVDSDQGRGFIGVIRRLDQRPEIGEVEHYEVGAGQPSDVARPRLTNREIEVLHILADGGRNKDIAAEMTVSLHTVKFHIENLYNKLEVRTRGELIRVATRLGLLAD